MLVRNITKKNMVRNFKIPQKSTFPRRVNIEDNNINDIASFVTKRTLSFFDVLKFGGKTEVIEIFKKKRS